MNAQNKYNYFCYMYQIRYLVACSRLSDSADEGHLAGSGTEKGDPARRWSRLSPARFFDRPHWPRAWNRLVFGLVAPIKEGPFVSKERGHISEV